MEIFNHPVPVGLEERFHPNSMAPRHINESWMRRRDIPALLRPSGGSDRIRVYYFERPDNVVVVQQAAYGILSAETSKKSGIYHFETGAMSTCISLIFTDPGRECILAHVDFARKNSLSQVVPEHRPDYSRAIVAFNHRYSKRILGKVEEFAHSNAERVYTLPLGYDIAVGVRLDGGVYRISQPLVWFDDIFFLRKGYLGVYTVPDTKEDSKRISSNDPNFKMMELP